MLDQFTSSDIDVFYGGWNIGARAKGKRLGTLRAFFRFCMNRKWLRETPVSTDVKPPIGANRVANKAPYTDEELQRIIDACDSLGEVAWSNGRENGVYTGEDVKDFIWVMVYTGLRISDVGLFNMSRLRGNEVFLRAKKNGGDVFAYIPDWLRDRLSARAKRCGVRPFVVGHSDRLETVTDMWRRKIGKVFELAGGIVNLGNLLAVSPSRATANLLICGPDVGRARLKIVEICLNLTMPLNGIALRSGGSGDGSLESEADRDCQRTCAN